MADQIRTLEAAISQFKAYEGMILKDKERDAYFIVTSVDKAKLRGVEVDDGGPSVLDFCVRELPISTARKYYKPYLAYEKEDPS